ncbi:GumC family protein [Methylobacterium sp. JK268]
MLRTSPATLPEAPLDAEVQGPTITFRAARGILRRSALPIVIGMALGVAVAAAVVQLSVPTYVATAQLLIEAQRQQPLGWFEPGMLDLTLDNAQVESQVEVLRSERISGAVAADLKLTEDAEFRADDVSGPARDAAEQTRRTISLLSRAVGVRRVGQSYVIEITASSRRPDRAAEIANAYTGAYLRDQFEAKAQAARTGADWLKIRIDELRETLGEASRAVEDFRTRNDLVTASGNLLIEQQLSEMNSQLIAARAQTAQAAAKLARIRSLDGAGRDGAAVSEVLNNAVMTNLRQRRQENATREAELRERYGPSHEAVAAAHREVLQAEADIETEMRRIGQIYLSDHEIALRREQVLSEELRRLIAEADRRRQAKVTLAELEARAQSYRKMYQSLLERLAETVQKETLPVSSARVIAPATIPVGRSSPKTKLALALGAALGLLSGLGIGTLRHSTDQTLRLPQDLPRRTGLDCLGLVPAVRRAPRRRPLGLTVLADPFSAYSRALRGVKVSLDVARESRRVGIIGVASVLPREGKSSVALNLAALFAQANGRTLLIDADFLRAGLTRLLTPRAEAGLIEALMCGQDVIVPTEVPRLSFLPLVMPGPVAQSSDLLRSTQMQSLLAELAGRYDMVILDLTPMRETRDARAVGRLLDGMLMVATWGRTEAGDVAEAAAMLDAAHAHLFGVLLNAVRDHALVARTV